MKLLLLALTACSAGWETDPNAAFARARAEQRDVLLEAYADWSVPSVMLHERLHSPVIGLRTSAFVRLFVDVTQEDETDPVQRDFALTTAPLLLVITPGGTVQRVLTTLPEAPQVLADFLDDRLPGVRCTRSGPGCPTALAAE